MSSVGEWISQILCVHTIGRAFLVFSSKESAWNAADADSIPGSERSPGERNGNPLQYSCLENSMDRGAWQATVLGVGKNWT